MKRLLIALQALFVIVNLNGGVKNIERRFKVNENQIVELTGLSGSLQVKAWDKEEVAVKLKIEFSSSKDEYEANFLKSADVIAANIDGKLKIWLRTIGEEGKWSYFLGIKYNLMYSESRNISGEIYVPRKNPLKSGVSYSNISLQDMKGEIELNGSGNKLELINCGRLKIIKNNYGDVRINDCAGNLYLACQSGKVAVFGHKGNLTVDGNYSTVNLESVSENVSMTAKSGKHSISNIGGNLILKGDYSTSNISNIGGGIDIASKSATLFIKKGRELKINGAYSKIQAFDIGDRPGNTVEINGASGDLLLENIFGNVSINSPFSNMQLKKINGDVIMSGKSSTITGEHINGAWNSKTEYAKLLLSNISAKKINITNKSGLIDLNLSVAPRDVEIYNEYADVKLLMEEGFSGELDLTTRYGKVKSNMPISSSEDKAGRVHATGKIRGGGGLIKIVTSSGNITVNQK